MQTLERRRVAREALLPRPFLVRDVLRDTDDTVTLLLDPVDGRPLYFQPGQFTMLGCPGFPEVPISVSGDPQRPSPLVQTVRDVGAATAALVGVSAGDEVFVRGPYGRGWDPADASGGDVLVVAGGIGLAPLRPVLHHVVDHRDRYGRVVLVHGSRTPELLLYGPQLERWRRDNAVEVALTVDAAGPHWRGHVGVVTTVLPSLGLDLASMFAFVCGPEIMMRLTADDLCRLGTRPERIRLSLERNMKCGVGLCGHCQLRQHFVCLDGPVFDYPQVRGMLTTSEL